MLGDTYNAPKNASIIYLGLVLAGKDINNCTQIERHVVLNMQEGQTS